MAKADKPKPKKKRPEPTLPPRPERTTPLGPDDDGGRRWWEDPELRRARLAGQVQAMVAALEQQEGKDSILVVNDRGEPLGPDAYGDMDYLCRQGRLLARDEDVAAIKDALGLNYVDDYEDGIRGLTVLGVSDTLDALRTVDRVLGAGYGYPDHVVYLTGFSGSACPATEPLPTAASAPQPPVSHVKGCTGEGVRVAVVDTGFDAATAKQAPWLTGVTGEQEVVDPADLGHYTGHGTFVAGVLRCVAPEATVHVHSFLPHGGAILETDIVQKLSEALQTAPDIVSMSAGARSRRGQGLLGFDRAWAHYAHPQTLLISAAGNDGSSEPFYPAATDYAWGVGAVTARGRRAPYSNFGPWVDVYAQGSGVVNAYPDGRYVYREEPLVGYHADFNHGLARWSGTSFATPLVAGMVAARMSWSAEKPRAALQSLMVLARAHARPGVGPVLEPWMACPPDKGGMRR